MAADLTEGRLGARALIFRAEDTDWKEFQDGTYECRVLLCPESDGGFSALALRLPGVVSQGETIEEALGNIADAFQATVQSYLEAGAPIPWSDISAERPKDCLERWILVNV